MKKNYFIGVTLLLVCAMASAQPTSYGGLVAFGTTAGVSGDVSSSYFGHGAGINSASATNTFIGGLSGSTNGMGEGNTFLGYASGLSNTSGYNNTFLGRLSGLSNTTGFYNTFIGESSGNSNNGNSSVFLGAFSGFNNSTGNRNTFIGRSSGYLNLNGSDNVFLGYQAGYNETGSNRLYIDNSSTAAPLIWGDFTNNLLNINGSAGINTNAPSATLDVNGTARIRTLNQNDALTQVLVSDNIGNLGWRADATLDDQNLSVITSGTDRTINITNGAGINFSVADDDNNPVNEIQDLEFSAGIITLTNDPGATAINLSAYDSNAADDFNGDFNSLTNIPSGLSDGDDVNDADANPVNEIQDLSFAAGIITLSNDPTPTSINLSAYDSNAADDFNGNFNSLTNIPPGLSDGDDVNDADADPTNELQILSYSDFTQTLSLLSIGGALSQVNLSSLSDDLGNHQVTQNLLPALNNSYNLGSGAFSFNHIYFNGALFINNTRQLHTPGSNIALGANTLNAIAVGALENVAIGESALQAATTGNYNTALGAHTMENSTIGVENTAIGYSALSSNQGGSFNTALGSYALETNASGTYNTAIGYASGPNHPGRTNTTAIGNGALITANNQVRIGNNAVTSIGGYANWSNLSDGRFKKNIKDDVAGLAFIEQLRPISYEIDNQKLNVFLRGEQAKNATPEAKTASERAVGFVAQEVEQLIKANSYVFSGVEKPQNEHTHYSLRYAEFVVPLVKGMQELSAKAKAQQDLIATQQRHIETLQHLMQTQQEKMAALEQWLYGAETAAEVRSKITTHVEGFVLYQNTPNPFHQSTVIKAWLPQSAQAKIAVYTLQGLELESYPLSGQGEVSVEISGGHLPSGMYLYALIADGQPVDVKKMLLTK
jgi:trimeric autotransporter adhesin